MTLEQERNHDEDIRTYINSRLLVDDDVDSDLVEKIKTQILVKSSGIFLWVNLVVHQLNELEIQPDRMDVVWRHLQEIPRAAKETPAPGEAITLYGLFKDVIKKDNKGIDEFIRLAQIIFRAKRPMRPKEIYVVLRECYDNSFDSDQVSDQTIARTVLRTSKGLAEVTRSKQPTVQFIHETVREFLREGGLQSIFEERTVVDGHEVLKTSCLQQLRAPVSIDLPILAEYHRSVYGEMQGKRRIRDFRWEIDITPQTQKDFQENANITFPFLEYASRNLLFHANEAEALGISQRNLIENFPSEQWIPIHNLFERYNTRRYHGIGTPLIYILASKGCLNLIQLLPNSGEDCVRNIKGEEFPSALISAIFTGNLVTAYALLGQDPADIPDNITLPTKDSFKSKKGGSLLRALTLLGDLKLLRKALEGGICCNDVVEMDKVKTEEVLDLLIEFSMLPHFRADGVGSQCDKALPLHGNLPFLRQAIDRIPSLLTERVWAGETMWEYAVRMKFWTLGSVYFELVGGGQDHIDNCLRIAAATGTREMLSDAFSRGANVNSQDEHGQTALHIALRRWKSDLLPGFSSIAAECLSQQGVDGSIPDNKGVMATDLIVNGDKKGYFWDEFMVFFIKFGVNPNTLVRCPRCEDHQIPLLTASLIFNRLRYPRSYTEVFLISNPHCELDRRDNLGRTTLSWCLDRKHAPLHSPQTWASYAGGFGLSLLESLRLDVNSRDNMGWTILERFIRRCQNFQSTEFDTFVERFFRAECLDPNQVTSNGQSPLQLIISLYNTFDNINLDEYRWNERQTLLDKDRQKLQLWHLPDVLRLLLGTKKVDLETQRECVSKAPPEIRSIIIESLTESGYVYPDDKEVVDNPVVGEVMPWLGVGDSPSYDGSWGSGSGLDMNCFDWEDFSAGQMEIGSVPTLGQVEDVEEDLQ